MSFPVADRVWAEIDLDALANNLRWIRHGIGPRVGVITVVKADAYGHGLKSIAAHLMRHGTDILGVANLGEAAAVRAVGKGWPILMLGACSHEAEFAELCREGICATVGCRGEIEELARVSRRLGCVTSVHLKIDTGMGRLGAPVGFAVGLARSIVATPALTLDGVYSHLSSSEDDAAFTRGQLEAFDRVVDGLRKAGVCPRRVHVMNSGEQIYEERVRGNQVRPGLLVYGVVPEGRRPLQVSWVKRLRPVFQLKTRVTFVKTVAADSPISYGQREVTARRTVLATVGAGYGDGIPRSASRLMEVLIRGRRCRVRGVVTMDQTVVDVTEVGGVGRGDEVVVIGEQDGATISASELAGWGGTIPWEILTSVTHRVPRRYHGIRVG